MKTMKSMLIKILSVICAFSCCFALCFGLVACGEEEVVIVGSSINNGKFVLTYSDGSSKEYDIIGKDGVDGEDGKDLTACAHENKVEVGSEIKLKNLGEESATICTLQQAVCLDCDHVFVVSAGHDLQNYGGREATCYANGETAGKKCSVCDYLAEGATTIDKSTVAHTEKTYFIAYGETDKSPCTHGGFLITVCEVCREQGINEILEKVDVAPLGHVSSNWYFASEDDKPTKAEKGTLTAAICDDCGMSNVTKELPKLNATDYVETLEVAKEKCTDTETYNYKIVIGEQEFNFEYVTEAGNHKVTDTIVFEDGKVYTYDAAIFKKFGNAEETCAASGFDVFFECKDCEQFIQTKAKVAHKTVFEVADNPETEAVETPTVDTPATCTTDGAYAPYVCPVCEETITSVEALAIPKLGHKFESYRIDSTNADGTVNLISNCVRYAECGIVDTIANAKAVYNKEEATCLKAGKETWTVTEVNGVALEEALVAENVLVVVPHKLGDEEIDLDKVYDWTVYEEKGFKGFGNVEYTCEDGGFNVFFYCSSCEEPISVSAEVPHTVPADPTPDDNINELITVTPPTCGVIGSEVYTCTVCYEEQTKYIDALVHEVTYSMTVDNKGTDTVADDIATIKATCVHGDKHVDADTREEVVYNDLLTKLVKTEKVKATCLVDGIDTYTWTNGTESLSADVNTGKAFHKLNGKYINDTETQYIGNGIVAMGNSTPACNSTTPGQGMFTCEHCEKPISVPVKEAHTKPATGVATTPASCTAAGSVNYVCAKCNENVSEPIEQLSHKVAYVASTYVAPTDTEDGEIKVACATCDTKGDTVVLPKLSDAKLAGSEGATNYTYKVVSEASCQADGVITYTYVDATYGAYSFNIVVPAVDHDVNDVPEYTWIYNGKLYTGKVCKLGEADEKHIVIIKIADAPAA